MIVRYYDPTRDTAAEIAALNPFPPNVQANLAAWYTLPFPPQNLIVAEEGGKLVGVLHIFDGGFPWALLDGFYLAPATRTLAHARTLGQFAEEELRRRGIPMYMTCAPERLARGLQRYGLTSLYTPLTLLGRRLQDG